MSRRREKSLRIRRLAEVMVSVNMLAVLIPCAFKEVYAQQPVEATRASLAMEISEEARVCVSPDELRERVSARLGYDPFLQDAPLAIRVEIAVDGADKIYVATISTKRQESPPRERALESQECQDLIDAVVFAMALAIDPVRSMQPATFKNTAREPLHKSITSAHQAALNAASISEAMRRRARSSDGAASTSARTAQEARRAQEDAARWKLPPLALQMIGSAGARFAEMPTTTADAGAGFEIDFGRKYRVSLDLRNTLPARYETVYGGQITLSTRRTDLGICRLFLRGLLATCAMTSAGAYEGRGEGFGADFKRRAGLFGVGASAKAGWMFTERFGVRLSVDGARMLSRASWRVGDEVLHTTPGWSASTQLQFVYRLQLTK